MEPFPYYAQVEVITAPKELASLVGRTGVIFGREEEEHEKRGWGYAVFIDGECSCLHHSDLRFTGVQFQRSDFYSGESIKVFVDEDGNGYVKGSRIPE